MAAFDPARRLYARHGFDDCAPFADYADDPNSVFMTRDCCHDDRTRPRHRFRARPARVGAAPRRAARRALGAVGRSARSRRSTSTTGSRSISSTTTALSRCSTSASASTRRTFDAILGRIRAASIPFRSSRARPGRSPHQHRLRRPHGVLERARRPPVGDAHGELRAATRMSAAPAIRRSRAADAPAMLAIINDAAARLSRRDPGRPLARALHAGGRARERDRRTAWRSGSPRRTAALLGVMGIQDKGDVALVRHAYVAPVRRGGGIGTMLLRHVTRAHAQAHADRHLGGRVVGDRVLRAQRVQRSCRTTRRTPAAHLLVDSRAPGRDVGRARRWPLDAHGRAPRRKNRGLALACHCGAARNIPWRLAVWPRSAAVDRGPEERWQRSGRRSRRRSSRRSACWRRAAP